MLAFCPVFGGAFAVRFVAFSVVMGDGTDLVRAAAGRRLASRRLGVDYEQLENPASTFGIGGSSEAYTEPAIVVFSDDAELCCYRIDMLVAAPSAETESLPSLLGRDIINQWRVTYDHSVPEFLAEVVTADIRT